MDLLRHSKIVHLLQSGVNLIYVRDLLGHSDCSTTQIYDHLFPQVGEEMASRLNEEMEYEGYGAKASGAKQETVPDNRFQVLRFGKGGIGAEDKSVGTPETRLPA